MTAAQRDSATCGRRVGAAKGWAMKDALRRTSDVDDKEAIIAAIGSSKLDTLAGPVDFTAPVEMGTMHPVKNVYRSPLVTGQWVPGDKYK